MKFPRAIRLDDSDTQVYDKLATPGEWAVPGSFAFLEIDPDKIDAKKRQAFDHGFLGTESFGWTTLVEVAEISESEYEAIVERLAAHFVEHYGAPDMAAALPTAREEADFAASICEHELHTLLILQRELSEEGVSERFRVARAANAAEHDNVTLFTFVEEDETNSK